MPVSTGVFSINFFGFHLLQILDEVERRRGISAALVYPFMRSVMESPFPAPGKTIKVKTFLPGAGNEVRSFSHII